MPTPHAPPPEPGDPMPSVLTAEMKEIFGDIIDDFNASILDTDRETMLWIQDLILDTMSTQKDGEEILSILSTQMVWFFLIGREHHKRGMAPPFARADNLDDLVTDDDIRDLLDDEDR